MAHNMKTKKRLLSEAIRLKIKHNLTNKAFVDLYEHLHLFENAIEGDADSQKQYWLSKVRQHERALEYVPTDLKGYKEIALAAVQQDGAALEYVPNEYALKNVEDYKEIALAALKNNSDALKYVTDYKLRDELIKKLRMYVKSRNDGYNITGKKITKKQKLTLERILEEFSLEFDTGDYCIPDDFDCYVEDCEDIDGNYIIIEFYAYDTSDEYNSNDEAHKYSVVISKDGKILQQLHKEN